MTHDISRSAHDPKKHYASALFQQGRIPLDDDLNEADTITKEDARATRVDVIGPAGSPDNGFLMQNVGNKIVMQPGTMYVGGLRVVLDEPETFDAPLDVPVPDSPMEHIQNGKTYLIYLEVWQQVVTAAEDAELLEPALGGPDTSVRLRTMHWARCLEVTTSDCDSAWETFVKRWPPGEFDTINNELRSSATLTVDFDPAGVSQNACSPGVKAGYLGAENQTIRVQVTNENPPTFVWGFDNASSLYRASAKPVTDAGVTRAEIFIPPPRDEEHWPRAGQTVELLGVSSHLPNGDPIAELHGGVFPVFRSYNPASGSFIIDRDPTGQLVGDGFVRVWNQGDASSLEQPVVKGTPIKLGNTGVIVTFDGPVFRRNDHWIVGVRPETDYVIPRDLKKGRAPNGVRRFYAPLGLVTVDSSGNIDVHDCRPTFDPLTTRTGCCTYTVGSKRKGVGHFDTIQDAVNNLPQGGGEICVLAGDYDENVVIDGKSNIRIHGCGARTLVRPNDEQLPAITITGSTSISIAKMGFEALGPQSSAPTILIDEGTAVTVAETMQSTPSVDIDLRDLWMHIRGGSAVMARAQGLRIVDVDVAMSSLSFDIDQNDSDIGAYPAIVAGGERILIERVRIECDDPDNLRQHALGGIQIGGDTKDVEIRRCKITHGRGNGITLGEIVSVDVQETPIRQVFRWIRLDAGVRYIIDDSGCLGWIPAPPPGGPTDGGDTPTEFVAGCPLEGIRIIDNEIRSMGLSGIAVARLFPPVDLTDMGAVFKKDASISFSAGVIETHELLIEGNRIFDCVQLHMNQVPQGVPYLAVGGIILADASAPVIRDNDIERNGAAHDDPACGIYIGYGEQVVIERNRISRNGPDHWPGTWDHYRGGIIVTASAWVLDELTTSTQTANALFTRPPSLSGAERFEALRVCDNVVLSPLGPALDAIVFGPSVVHANNFTSCGAARTRPLIQPSGEVHARGKISNWERGGAAVSIEAMVNPVALFMRHGVASSDLTDLGGDVLFDSNVVTHQPTFDEAAPFNIVYLAAYDDLACLDNQITSIDVAPQTASLYAFGRRSLRVSNNRVREPDSDKDVQFSILTCAIMNQTSFNQTDHCTRALGFPSASAVAYNLCSFEHMGDCLIQTHDALAVSQDWEKTKHLPAEMGK